ncbi:hypothetical protein PN499_09460 [Kamptonema animale CS-326]|jgi:hypothetical protein|uniref:hypothetical protein n=1 Tax=Kamptonema animale TaxID=92934 RepID=UPI00232F66E5|nr:hypothetical protein [Kamptonema animale]MDB9511406.1 hypothetical protein [Kamptonema animale CS-326]
MNSLNQCLKLALDCDISHTLFALWLTNPVPVDWMRYRDQWEYTHAVNAFIKIIGLSLLAISVLVETPTKRESHSELE